MLRFVTCDVFTETRFAGNPLAIVEAADALGDAAMQTIAREFNLSETIFVRRPRDPAHTASVRIFFPTGEIPFAGHPTIGCAIHLALQGAPDGDFDTTITLEEVAGLVPVRVRRNVGTVRAELRAPVIPYPGAGGTCPSDSKIAAALGLDTAEIGFGTHRPALWQGGPAFAYVPLRDRAALSRAHPAGSGWQDFCTSTGLNNVYVYTEAANGYAARMFAPGDGVPEDPGTGSASAILAAQLLASGALPEGETRLQLDQGRDMGRPCEIGLRITVQDGALTSVHVSGSAVQVSEGLIAVPGI